jgi:hypothetical protein
MRSSSSAEGLTKLTDYVNDQLEGCEREEILMGCMSTPAPQ